jgi:DNA primase
MSVGLDFLYKRGLSDETILNYGLMYYKDEKMHAIPDRFGVDFIKHAKGLVTKRPDEEVSKFDNCVLFPVLNLHKRLVSLYARRLEGKPKFDALHFDKKNYLYILNRDHAYIVEGIFDFLVLWQHGVRNAVCPLGCSISHQQMCLLGRFANNFTVVFDPDQAGKDGMRKARNLFSKHGYRCNTIFIPEGLDLDDYILKYGVERFLKHAKNTPQV